MIQVYATSNLLKLLDTDVDDPFVVERRIEKRLALNYSELYPGITHNKDAVKTILGYLEPMTSQYHLLIDKLKEML